MKKEFCQTCHAVVTPVLSTRKENITFKGEVFSIDAVVASCGTCGEEFLTAQSHDANLRAVQDAYRAAHNLLSVDEIKEIRTKYGLSQASFARVLGLGEKTITRYENGYVPDKAQNNLIRLMDNPENFRLLYESEKDILRADEINTVKSALSQLHTPETVHCVTVEVTEAWSMETENVIKFPFQLQKQTYSSEVNTEYAYG